MHNQRVAKGYHNLLYDAFGSTCAVMAVHVWLCGTCTHMYTTHVQPHMYTHVCVHVWLYMYM